MSFSFESQRHSLPPGWVYEDSKLPDAASPPVNVHIDFGRHAEGSITPAAAPGSRLLETPRRSAPTQIRRQSAGSWP